MTKEEKLFSITESRKPSWREDGASILPRRPEPIPTFSPTQRQAQPPGGTMDDYGPVPGRTAPGSYVGVVVGLCRNGQPVSGTALFANEPS